MDNKYSDLKLLVIHNNKKTEFNLHKIILCNIPFFNKQIKEDTTSLIINKPFWAVNYIINFLYKIDIKFIDDYKYIYKILSISKEWDYEELTCYILSTIFDISKWNISNIRWILQILKKEEEKDITDYKLIQGEEICIYDNYKWKKVDIYEIKDKSITILENNKSRTLNLTNYRFKLVNKKIDDIFIKLKDCYNFLITNNADIKNWDIDLIRFIFRNVDKDKFRTLNNWYLSNPTKEKLESYDKLIKHIDISKEKESYDYILKSFTNIHSHDLAVKIINMLIDKIEKSKTK